MKTEVNLLEKQNLANHTNMKKTEYIRLLLLRLIKQEELSLEGVVTVKMILEELDKIK